MGRRGGFTLIEVLVAFAVLAVSLGLSFEIFSTGLKSVETAQARTKSLLHAQSMLATVGTGKELEEGTSDGEFDDGYGWRLSVQRLLVEEEGVETPGLPLAFVVRVTVAAMGSAGVTLTSLRLVLEQKK